MKNLILLLTITCLYSCSIHSSNTDEKESKIVQLDMNDSQYKEVKKEVFDSLLTDICSSKDLEFMDLYATIDSISSAKYEKLILVDSLKSKGFKVINWGSGNWMEGPRIVSFTLSNGTCECQVDKLYYSTEQENRYKVTERIKCIKKAIN